MVFLGFTGVFVSTTGLESFSLGPEKFSKWFSFGGGCVRFFLLCMSDKLLIVLRGRPCLELIIVSSNFQRFALLAGQTTGISLKALNSSKKVLEIIGPALSRIDLRTLPPPTGLKIPKIGKKGFGIKELPFPSAAAEKGALSQKIPIFLEKWDFFTPNLSAPNRAIWLRLRFVIRIANRKSLAIWDSVNLLRKAHCSDLWYKKLALRF